MIDGGIDSCVQNASTVLYECVTPIRVRTRAPTHDILLGKWERLLDSNVVAQIWIAIDWSVESNDYEVPQIMNGRNTLNTLLNPTNAHKIELESLHRTFLSLCWTIL